MNTESVTQHRKDAGNEPIWPVVEWGAAAITLVGLLLLVPAGAYFVSLLSA